MTCLNAFAEAFETLSLGWISSLSLCNSSCCCAVSGPLFNAGFKFISNAGHQNTAEQRSLWMPLVTSSPSLTLSTATVSPSTSPSSRQFQTIKAPGSFYVRLRGLKTLFIQQSFWQSSGNPINQTCLDTPGMMCAVRHALNNFYTQVYSVTTAPIPCSN